MTWEKNQWNNVIRYSLIQKSLHTPCCHWSASTDWSDFGFSLGWSTNRRLWVNLEESPRLYGAPCSAGSDRTMQSPVAMETEVLLMDTKSDYYKMPYSDLELDEVHGVDMTQATLSGMSKKKVGSLPITLWRHWEAGPWFNTKMSSYQ